jgi:pantetheine-phosphate adenylyltransferase
LKIEKNYYLLGLIISEGFAMMKKAVYAGTFDPITLGHLDVIKRGAEMFDELIVGITDNPAKKPLFSVKERVFLAKKCTNGMKGVKVMAFKGLLADFAEKQNALVLLRGLREVSDFPKEFQQAIVNRKLNPEVETVFVMTSAKYFYLTSSIVKEIASLGGCISGFVPDCVESALRKKSKMKRFK